MSKKKSYMDRKNIINEGFLGKILMKVLPKSVIHHITKNDPELKKIEKKLQKKRDEMDVLHKKSRDYYLKKHDIDIDDLDDSEYRKEFLKWMQSGMKGPWKGSRG
jgi:aspartyl/asparaginyl beta-hydroxylase (cupin superfamily)